MTVLHGYHAHIYYGDDSRLPVADTVCKDLAARFPVELGNNNGVAGPHPIAQRQVIFRTSAFAEVVPWLMATENDAARLNGGHGRGTTDFGCGWPKPDWRVSSGAENLPFVPR